MNTVRKLGLTAALATLVAVPLVYAQESGPQGMNQGQMMQSGGMMGQGNMPGMMGMMQQMGPMMEACTEMMQAMTGHMESHGHAAGKG